MHIASCNSIQPSDNDYRSKGKIYIDPANPKAFTYSCIQVIGWNADRMVNSVLGCRLASSCQPDTKSSGKWAPLPSDWSLGKFMGHFLN